MTKRFFSVIALMCALCLIFTSCAKTETEKTSSGVVADDNVTAPGELPIVKDKISLTVGIISSSKVENFDTNAFTKYLEEKTNIDLKFYLFPASGGYDKVKVMLASGAKMPDILCGVGLDKSTLLQYGSEGTLIDLTDYMDEYGYWLKDVYKKTKVKNLDSWLSCADGKKYFMPHIIEQVGNLNGGKAFINKKWLDKLGLDMPETIDDFVKVMKAFETQDPNGNGKADEIGFTGSKDGWNEKPVDFLMNSYVYDDYGDGFVVDDHKKVSLNYMTDEYKAGLKKVSGMVKQGLIDVQCYTQSSEILRSIACGDDNVIGAFASGSPDSLFGSGSERLGEYVALPPLKGPKGVAYAYTNVYRAGVSGIITKYCKNPLAAFRLMDFMLSKEASTFCRYGVEGKDWKKAEPGSKAIFSDLGFEAKIMAILPYGAVQNSHWFQNNPAYRSSDISDTLAWNGDPLDGEYFKAKALTAYYGKGPKNICTREMLLLDLDDMEEFNGLQADISSYVKENVALFVTGEKNVDKEWDSFQSDLENLNVKRYLELIQKGYDNFTKKQDK